MGQLVGRVMRHDDNILAAQNLLERIEPENDEQRLELAEVHALLALAQAVNGLVEGR